VPTMFVVLDILAIVSAVAASVLWYRAGAREVRRVSKSEELDAADINRLVVAMNRSAILNRRAALATAASTLCLASRFAASLVLPA